MQYKLMQKNDSEKTTKGETNKIQMYTKMIAKKDNCGEKLKLLK